MGHSIGVETFLVVMHAGVDGIQPSASPLWQMPFASTVRTAFSLTPEAARFPSYAALRGIYAEMKCRNGGRPN
jgi:hypothetical protein